MAIEQQAKDALIRAHIGPSRHHPGPADVLLTDSGVPVWVIVAQYLAADRDAAYVARSYEVPLEAVQAAIAYYEDHAAVIDARLAANSIQ